MQNATADWVCFANASFSLVFQREFLKISIYFENFKNWIFYKFFIFLFLIFLNFLNFTAPAQFRAVRAGKLRRVNNLLLNLILKFKFYEIFNAGCYWWLCSLRSLYC